MNDHATSSGFSAVQQRIEEIADLAGIAGSARLSVDETLAALSSAYRRRLVLTLESLKAFSPDEEVREAAELYQLRAAQIWAAIP
jgi:hypothetical protein